MTDRWLSSARAAHTRALGAPQSFPLFGDGRHTSGVLDRISCDAPADGSVTGAALAEARYRDWFAARASGAIETRVTAAAPPPELTLMPESESRAVQSRLVLPAKRAADRDSRLAQAELIIRGLVDEFGELFPDELAAAKRWLNPTEES